MSFDLWVWKGPPYTLATINYGIARFEGGDPSAFEASEDVAAFAADLRARLPVPGPIAGNGAKRASPWASPPSGSDRMIAMRLRFTVRDEQLDEILRLVEAHDLWLYDPQRALVQPPRSQRDAPPGEAPFRTLEAPDGTRLRLRRWPARGKPWASILIVHGISEHSGRYERAAQIWAEGGLDVFAFDLRGHGGSGGRRMHVDRWDEYLDDVAHVMGAIVPPGRPRVLFGHSLGALVALTYACSDRARPDLLVLSALPLDARIPFWQRAVAPVLSRIAPTVVIATPVSGEQLSRDPEVGRAYFADPLVQPRSTARLGHELMTAMVRARHDLEADRLQVPTLAIHGSDDTLVPVRVSEAVALSAMAQRRVLRGLRHESLNEPEGPEVARAILDWIRRRLGRLPGEGPELGEDLLER